MTLIQTEEDLDPFREYLSDIWERAVLRISFIKLDHGTRIPNGELVFLREPCEETGQIRYKIDDFVIYEITSQSPLELLSRVLSGQIPTVEDKIEIDTDLYSHNTSGYFQTGIEESRVEEDRPLTEFNGVIDVEITDEEEEKYSEKREDISDRLKRAEEPYYDTGRAQDFYFERVFATKKNDPKILVFANPDITYHIEDDELELVFPEPLQDDLFISVLPQRPYGEHKGWRIEIADKELTSTDGNRLRFREELDLEGIENVYVVLYLGEQLLDMIDYVPSSLRRSNPRFQILDSYDPKANLVEYLEAPPSTDTFEVAVFNVLTTAGYFAHWFGETSFKIPNWTTEIPRSSDLECDVIAYPPDGTEVLFIECTVSKISNKEDILERSKAVADAALEDDLISVGSGLFQTRQIVPCIATPQPPNKLSEEIVNDLEDKNVEILHTERLKAILEASQRTDDTVPIDTEFVEVI
jgi:hypothetical protein